MIPLLRNRLVLLWLALVTATCLSATIGGSAGLAHAGSHAFFTVMILAIAFAKAGIVMHSFMDLRRAPPALAYLAAAWLVVVLVVLIGIYLGKL